MLSTHTRISTALLVFICSSSVALAQNAATDSLERVLPGQTGMARMKTLADLTWEWSSMDADKAIQYGEEYLRVAEQTKDSTEVGEAANLLAVALYRKGKYDDALAVNHRAYRIRKASGDQAKIGSSLNKFVNIYSDRVMLDSALKYGLESVRIYEQLGDSGSLAISLNTISNIYQKERDWNTSLEYAQKAYAIANSLGFDYAIGGAAGNKGVAYEGLDNLNESIKWYLIARDAFQRVGSFPDLATVANNLGFVYRKQGDLAGARTNYLIALEMAEKLNENNGIAHYSANLGGISNALKNYPEAKEYFEKALVIAEREGLGRIRLQCYDGLAEVTTYSNRPTEALAYFRKYSALKDSLYNDERSAQLAEMRTRYETEKKEQENAFLRTENELKDRRTRAIVTGFAAGMILLSLSGFLYYQSYRRRQALVLQSEIIKERERGLEAVFDATEEERRRIARDLHDGIGQQLSGLKMSWSVLAQKLQRSSESESAKIAQLTEVLDESAKEVRSLSHQMMPRTLLEQGLLPALEDMLHKSFGLSEIRFRLEHFRVEGERFDQRIETGLYRVAQELVSNIIRHSKATEVTVQLIRQKDILLLVVEDNGIGFSPQQRGGGIGLMNMKSRLATIRGEVHWEAGPRSGTVAAVRVPVAAVAKAA